MSSSGSKTLPAVAFLTACEHAEQGTFAGLLVLNCNGRPLEFHCTAPVKSNRAQEILYGPTLRRFLYGEQLGPALLSKVKSELLFICTDQPDMLAVRDASASPVLLVLADEDDLPKQLTRFSLGSDKVAVENNWQQDRDEIKRRWEPYTGRIDLPEPFIRIRDAIAEARKAA